MVSTRLNKNKWFTNGFEIVYLHKIQWYAQGLVLLLKIIACNWLVIMIGQGGNI
jgi:hypothetical protein